MTEQTQKEKQEIILNFMKWSNKEGYRLDIYSYPEIESFIKEYLERLPEKQEIKPICPIMSQYCKDKHCMFFRKGYTTTSDRGRKDSCWILDGFIGLARTWEIRE